MSMRALLLAVKADIQSFLSLTGDTAEQTVDVTDEGKPKGASGQKFYGIIGDSAQNDAQEYVSEYYTVRCVITLKVGNIPEDRLAVNAVLTATTGLWALAEALAARVHRREAIRVAANSTIGQVSPAQGFCEPLLKRSIRYLGAKGPDWFTADDEGDGDAPYGIAIEVTWDRCRYVDDT